MGVSGLVIPHWPEEPFEADCGEARPGCWPVGLDRLVDHLHVAVARDVAHWRVYHRYFRPLTGTLEPLRVNELATELVRAVEPDAEPVYEPCVIVGTDDHGGDCHVPPALVAAARMLVVHRRSVEATSLEVAVAGSRIR